MKWLVNFFKWAKSIIVDVYGFFASTIENIGKMADYVGDALADAWRYVDMLPSWLKYFATITVLVSVIYMFVGRDTGGK